MGEGSTRIAVDRESDRTLREVAPEGKGTIVNKNAEKSMIDRVILFINSP